jgi:hypothetical protein
LIERKITYTNPFTDEEVTETHYFHISKADLVEMEMEEHNAAYRAKNGQELTGMQAKLQRIIDSEDGKAIMFEFKDMIRRAYGIRDGNSFRKSAEIWDQFSSTEAFSQLLFELCTNAQKGAEFFNGVVPGNLEQIAAEVRAIAEKQEAESGDVLTEVASAVSQGVTPSQNGAPTDEGLGSPSAPGGALDEEVQATRTAADAESPVPPEERPGSAEWATARKKAIELATSEHPIDLSEDDVTLLTHQQLKAGLADGRYKLS